MKRSCVGETGDRLSALTDETVDKANILEEMAVDVPSDAHTEDTHSDVNPFLSAAVVMKGENSSDTQNADFEEKSRQNGDVISRKTTKRAKRTRTKRNDSDDENEDEEKDDDVEVDHKAMLSNADRKIQVGDDFQARVDEPQKERDNEMSTYEEREHVLWCPPAYIDKKRLNEYCEFANANHKLGEDQALYLLQKSNFDFDIAREKVMRRVPIKEEWSEDDRALFKQALLMFGKRFDKIRQMMPYRSMPSIIQFYYNTKKDSDYKSLIDTKMADDSEDDDSVDDQHNEADTCNNCGENCRVLYFVDDVQLCLVCWTHFRMSGKHRPCSVVSVLDNNRQRKRRTCPKDMLDIAHSFVGMSSCIDHEFTPDNKEVIDGMEIVQIRKTKCHEEMKAVMCELAKVRARAIRLEYSMKTQRSEGFTDGLDSLRYLTVIDKKDEDSFPIKLDKIKAYDEWSEEERMVAFRCLIRYEEDFDAVSEVVGTKTPDQIKSFYMEVKPDIDKVLKK
ncbi:hypothetical protein KIN20_028419 [Parelaphostrongylus tenuis]|uniref:Uncharacterized protein n=1 Tax=Parelaphostrongylus tenuis TaxID=148309 RepID=A0AAD5R117_PARTN|nr:hypothetical protein KIN20_028419 [Parelaphostrongylus tenuis]